MLNLNNIKSKQNFLIFGLFLSALILSLSFWLPIGSDQSIFLRAAKVILQGGTLYKDYIDIKPPLIYYLYLLPASLPFDQTFAVRISDLIFQLFTVTILFILVYKLTGDSATSLLSILLYSMFYIIQEYPNLGEAETFANLPLLLIALLILDNKHPDFWKSFLIGVLCGLLFLLKYDLILILVPIIIFIKVRKCKRITTLISSILSGFIFINVVVFLPVLWGVESRNGYYQTLIFLKYYARFEGLELNNVINSLKSLSSFISDNLSITLLLILFAGILSGLNLNKISKKANEAVIFLVILIASLVVTIIIENKYLPYYFQRLQSYLFVLIGLGIFKIKSDFYAKYKNLINSNKIIFTLLFVFFTIFSPLPRFLYLTFKAVSFMSNSGNADRHYEINHKSNEKFLQNKIISEYINCRNPDNEKVLLIATGMDNLSPLINSTNQWRMPHSVFYLSKESPEQWKVYFDIDFKKSFWIIIAKNDIFPKLNFDKSSYDYIMSDSSKMVDLQLNTQIVQETKDFILYKRTKL